MAYSKLSVEAALARHPHANVLTLAFEAVVDHTARNGCDFVPGAASIAVSALGLEPDRRAISLSDDELTRLSDKLEDLELNCPHKTPKET